MDESSRRPGLPPEIGVVLLVAAASLPLARLFRTATPGETGFGQVQILTIVTSAAVAWGLRRLHLPTLFSAACSALFLLWFGSALFHGGAMLGPFPTPKSIELLFETLDKGLSDVMTEAAPVAPVPRFLAITVLGIWATTWLVDDAAVRLRHPLLAIGLAVPIFAMPGTLIRGPHSWLYAMAFCAGGLVVLFQDERSRLVRWAGTTMRGWRPGLATRLGFVAVVLAAAAAPLLPGYGQPPGGAIRARGGGGRVTVNPLVSVRPSLDQFPAVDLFQVRSPAPAYWRLTSLDRFNGQVWTAAPEAASLPIGRGVRRTSPAPVATRVSQRYEIQNLAGPWLPAAYEAVQLSGLRGVRLQPTSRTLLASETLQTGSRYTVVSEIPTPTADDLGAETALDPREVQRYLQLPAGVGDSLRAIAQTITRGAHTRFEKVVAIQDHLRTFEYDEKVALRHNFSDLVRFLTRVRAGYCEQFAAAMAVLARTLDIPARVAVGFGTGDLIAQNVYEVTSQQAHAWPEIYFPTYGWMIFEPTPRTDGFDVPRYAQIRPDAGSASPSPEPTQATTTPTPTSTAGPGNLRDEEANTTVQSGSDRRALAPIAVLGVVVLLLVALPGAAAVRRRVRRRQVRDEHDAVAVRYVEFLEWCRAASVGRAPGETPREHARRLSGRPGAVPEPLVRLAVVATAAVYAGELSDAPGAVATAQTVRAARRAVFPTVGKSRRLLAWLAWGWWRSEERPPAGRPY